MRVLTAAGMKDLDARACAGVGDVELMRRAGEAIASLAGLLTPHRNVAGIAGPGNNGGDVFAAFAQLEGFDRTVVEMASPSPSAARRDARERALRAGVRIVGPDDAQRALVAAALCLDGIFGVGARLPLEGEAAALARLLNAQANVLAIDVPTGIDATTGAADPNAVKARATLTLGALKAGLFDERARDYVGELWFAGIGIDAAAYGAPESMVAYSDAEAAALLPHREADADKRDAGAPLVIAGSEQFPGAAVLCARAAARAGAGYVTVAAPQAAAGALRSHLIEQVVVSIDERDPGAAIESITSLSTHCTSLAIGPGLGLGDATGEIVRGIIRESRLPMVIDASALFHLAKHLGVLTGKAAVLTPHAGEFARLTGKGTIAPGERRDRLRAFTHEHRVVTLLKGRTTLVDDGERLYLNATGTNALATAGTGDVLSGIIATLLSQGLPPFTAASLGAYWHGLAGQIAHAWRPVGVVAGDVIEALADAAPAIGDARPEPIRIF